MERFKITETHIPGKHKSEKMQSDKACHRADISEVP